ncbi:MAG TPA: hypothetical protein VGW35_01745 [Methylomirabilota bacterium]|jgi:hypothetical protein|nr:hypothetical protein [Methylomirabilota bacterium]
MAIRILFAGAGLLGTLFLGGGARAEESALPASPGLDLSMRARALGVVPEPYSAATLGLEPMQAPTGAGITRTPRLASSRGSGVYISVIVCDADGVDRVYTVRLDDAGTLPEGTLRGTAGPGHLFVPGRP